MKLVSVMALSLALATGCNKTEGSAAPTGSSASSARAPAVASPAGSAKPGAAAAAAPDGESFFAGDVPAGVKMKPNKTFAMDPGILFIQGVDGWTGGQLPGYDYLGVSKDQSAVVRVATATGVLAEMSCKNLATAAAMAPLKAKNLADSGPTALRQVGKNKFVAREGACTAEGPKGPIEIHYLDILRKNHDELWHYAVLAAFPASASPELRNEVKGWARSLEYTGGNGFKLP